MASPSGTLRLDDAVAATPEHRDRTVDLLRVGAIAVVVLWHWTLSVAQWRNGAIVLPNPIDAIPLAWPGTWLLQVMPLFFLTGGFANRSSWQAARRRAVPARAWVASGLGRLGGPCAAMVLSWALIDLVASGVAGYPSVLSWGQAIFVPLWFLVAFGALSAATPWLNALHEGSGRRMVFGLALATLTVDALRFRWGWVAFRGVPNALVVFAFVHQLGFFWRDLAAKRPSHPAQRRTAKALTLGGFAALHRSWALRRVDGGYDNAPIEYVADVRADCRPRRRSTRPGPVVRARVGSNRRSASGVAGRCSSQRSRRSCLCLAYDGIRLGLAGVARPGVAPGDGAVGAVVGAAPAVDPRAGHNARRSNCADAALGAEVFRHCCAPRPGGPAADKAGKARLNVAEYGMWPRT